MIVIGTFAYAAKRLRGCIVLDLQWRGNRAEGTIHIPDAVAAQIQDTEYAQFESGQSFLLPIGLGLGVTLAALTSVDFCICGDTTAWREEWGNFEYLTPGAEEFPH